MKPELLAPAGNLACFEAAINAGADAIYAGAEQFSARAYADNLTTEQFISGIRQAHLHGVAVYLTLNTLINTNEYEEAYQTLRPLYEAGLDGIIVQDTGLIAMLRECFPDLKLHASTQMSIMNSYGAQLMKDQGFSRVVPARELTLPEVRNIKDKTGLEIECFIHGAMCYSYSGLCLMSSMIGGRSGNRGRCAGTCRLPFDAMSDGRRLDDVHDNGESYPLSMKDMCTVDILPQLIDAGIDSFKIEGRMKSPEYVAGVVSMYRKYIDMYLERGYDGYKISDTDRSHLSSLYIRSDISSGYYTGVKGRQLITPDAPGYNGNDDEYVQLIHDRYVHECDRIPADISAYIHPGEPAVISASAGYSAVSVTGVASQEAIKAPLTEEDVAGRLRKTGNSGFATESVSVDLGDNAFVPVGALNELRRQAYDKLADSIIEDKGFTAHRETIVSCRSTADVSRSIKNADPIFDISVSTQEQLDTVLENGANGIGRLYIDYSLALGLQARVGFTDLINAGIPEIYISLPAVMRDRIIRGSGTEDNGEALKLYERIASVISDNTCISGVLVHTLDELGYASEHLPGIKVITDTHIYTHNPYASEFLGAVPGFGGLTYPYELNLKGLHELSERVDSETTLVVYGYIPMMITAGCIRRTYGTCPCDRAVATHAGNVPENTEGDAATASPKDRITLRDRKGVSFPVVTDCLICTNKIYNERPLCLYDLVRKVITGKSDNLSDRYRIDFTIEDGDMTRHILTGFLMRDESSDGFFRELPTTTGHLKRGAQ